MVQVRLLLRRAIERSSSETLSKLVVSLEGNVGVFSLVCILKIRITENIGTCAVEVCLVKTG